MRLAFQRQAHVLAAPAPHTCHCARSPAHAAAPDASARELWAGAAPACTRAGRSRCSALAHARAALHAARESRATRRTAARGASGSLHLFAGVDGLCSCRSRTCARHLALAGGAGLRAHAARGPGGGPRRQAARGHSTRAQLTGQLAPLPLGALRWPEAGAGAPRAHRRAHHRGGAAPAARRFRAPLRRCAARHARCAHRAHADLRAVFQPRERFRRRRELVCELENTCTIARRARAAAAANSSTFLRARQCGVHGARVPAACTGMRRRRAACCGWRPRRRTRIAWRELFGEQLDRAGTAASRCARCELRARRPAAAIGRSARACGSPVSTAAALGSEAHGLIERLRARLGERRSMA